MLGREKKLAKNIGRKKKSIKNLQEKYQSHRQILASFYQLLFTNKVSHLHTLPLLSQAISAKEVQTQDFTSKSADLEITRPKRTKIEHQKVEEKPSIICNKIKMKGDVKRYRICDIKRAKQLVSTKRFFKDEVYNRCILLETAGNIFTADIKYHSNCPCNYLLKFKQEVELIVNDKYNFIKNEDIGQTFRDILGRIDLQHQTIHVSTIRDLLNKNVHAENISMLPSSET